MFDLYKTIAFTGAREIHPDRAALIREIAVKATSGRATVLVGCASGADEAVRRAALTAKVVSVRDFLHIPAAKARLAARSAALVQALVKQTPHSCLIAFPGAPCPPGLKPCRYPFKGHGSGTWATVALTLSYHVPCFVFPPFVPDEDRRPLPPAQVLPSWWGTWDHIGWGSPFGEVAGAYILRPSLQLQLQFLAPLPADVDDRLTWRSAAATGIPCF